MSTEVPAIKLRELLERAKKKGWLEDLADQIAACQLIKYRELRAAFLPLMARAATLGTIRCSKCSPPTSSWDKG
jgi:hypothetical protein